MSKKKKNSYAKNLITSKMESDEHLQLSKVLDENLDESSEVLDHENIEIDNLRLVENNSEDDQKTSVLENLQPPPPPPPLVKTTASESAGESDKTIALQVAKNKKQNKPLTGETKVSYGVKNFDVNLIAPNVKNNNLDKSAAISLRQSENLRIAQEKINDLEEEIDQLRRENDELASAGETYKQVNEKYFHDIEMLRKEILEIKETAHNEIIIYKKSNKEKDKKINEYKQQIEDLSSRIEVNFRKIRKREKELEHRLEIAKIEEVAVVKSKDKMILDLKKKVDQLSLEADNFKLKSQQNFEELQKKQYLMRGVVRALRLALTKLEGDIESQEDEES